MATIREIQDAVARRYGVTAFDLVGHRRTKEIYRPRQIAMWLTSRLTSHSHSAIGRHFGGRGHTTVAHALARVEQLLRIDLETGREVLTLLKGLIASQTLIPGALPRSAQVLVA